MMLALMGQYCIRKQKIWQKKIVIQNVIASGGWFHRWKNAKILYTNERTENKKTWISNQQKIG